MNARIASMPIQKPTGLRRFTQSEFGEISYAVMRHAFHIHSDMGCFFDELIYKNALKSQVGLTAESEVRIRVTYDDFCHDYYLDLLVEHGAVFELKCAEKIAAIYRAQLMNYLLLCDLAHGKLINFGSLSLEHEFVNANKMTEMRRRFNVRTVDWKISDFSDWMVGFLKDVGVGLDVNLYEKAAVHFFGGQQSVEKRVAISGLGSQTLNLACPEWGLRVTTLPTQAIASFVRNTERFVSKTGLRGFHWVNVGRDEVLFRSVGR